MHRLKKLQVVLCDWSGVISDDRKPVYETNSRMMEHFGHERLPYEIWLTQTTASPREFFAERGIVLKNDGLYALYQEMFPQVVAEGIMPTLYATALDFLAALAPRHITIISAHPQPFLEQEAGGYGLNGYIHSLQGSVANKADAISETLRAMKVAPERAAYVGDMVSDVRSAKRVGVLSVAVASGYHARARLEQESPDVIVDSLTELVPHL